MRKTRTTARRWPDGRDTDRGGHHPGGADAAGRYRDRRAPTRPSPLANTLTFAWRALLKIKHVPEQLFDVTLTPIIFTLMFTYLFGARSPGTPRPTCSTCCLGFWCRRS
ncbi:hypothetical protein NKG05_19105 [Oerskovia sp. M15]